MRSSRDESEPVRATGALIARGHLTVRLADGRSVTVPLEWYPRLQHATAVERSRSGLIAKGEGIRCPDLDEDISVESLLEGRASGESKASFERWNATRGARRRRSSGSGKFKREQAMSLDLPSEIRTARVRPALVAWRPRVFPGFVVSHWTPSVSPSETSSIWESSGPFSSARIT